VNRSKISSVDVISAILLISISVAWRYTVWASHLVNLSNVELITVSTIVAGLILRSRLSWIIPLAAVALSDAFIPNNATTMLYVWGAWLMIGAGNQMITSRKTLAASVPASSGKRVASVAALVILLALAAFSGRIFSPIGRLLSPVSLIVLGISALVAFVALRRAFPRLSLGLGLGIGSTLFFFAVTNLGVWLEGMYHMYPMTAQGLLTCYMRGLPFLERQMRATIILVPSAMVAGEAVVRSLSRFSIRSRAAQKI